MSMIDDWKEKANSYIEDVGKKKDELIEKAATLKAEHDENQRRKMESWVYKKEAELQELEKALKKREEILEQNERKLKQKFFIRFVGTAAGLSIIGFFALAVLATTRTGGNSFTSQSNNIKATSPSPNLSEPYTPKVSPAYSTYSDIDITNPKFDVGKYCLEKEKNSNITFEECLSAAAAKIMPRK
jgi:hypothetical protein